MHVLDEMMHLAREDANLRSVKLILNCDSESWKVRVVSDVSIFRRLIDLLLHDLIMTSGCDDLIQMEVLHGASDDGFTLRFIKVGKVGDARGMLLSKAFWTEDVYVYEKQEGPGICATLAKVLIKSLSGCVSTSMIDHQSFVLELSFPVHLENT